MNNTETISMQDAAENQLSLLDRLAAITSVSQALRAIGSGAIILALCLFLIEGWAEVNDLQRYFKLLGLTGLMTVAGISLSVWLKEHKGARVFFALSLVSSVANFTILGAMIYSLYPMGNLVVEYPPSMTWRALNPSLFWLTFVGAIALLSTLAKFSYGVFARKIATPLSVGFLALNSLLLIPVREANGVAIMAIIAIFAAIILTKRVVKHPELVLTNEVKFALLTLFIPSLIIVVRALGLYQMNEVFALAMSGTAYVLLRELSPIMQSKKVFSRLNSGVSLGLAFVIAYLVTALLPSVAVKLNLVLFSALTFLLAVDQVKRSESHNWKAVVLNCTLLVSIVGACMWAFAIPLLENQLSALLVSLMAFQLIKFSETQCQVTSRAARTIALIGVLVSILMLSYQLLVFAQFSNWVLFSALGVSLIVGASFYERHGMRMLFWIKN